MGNCQAVDTATLVIQQTNGKVERLYWPVSASEVMKTNPGHYVALLISTTLCTSKDNENCPNKGDNNTNPVRLTRIKLLKPTDTLVLGQVYRLISAEGKYLVATLSFTLFFFSSMLFFTLRKSFMLCSKFEPFMCFFGSEVMKGLWAKKQAKMKRNLSESAHKSDQVKLKPGFEMDKAGRRLESEDKQVNLSQNLVLYCF